MAVDQYLEQDERAGQAIGGLRLGANHTKPALLADLSKATVEDWLARQAQAAKAEPSRFDARGPFGPPPHTAGPAGTLSKQSDPVESSYQSVKARLDDKEAKA